MDVRNDSERRGMLLHAAYRAADVREMERPLLDDDVPLMRMAANAAAHVAARMLDDAGVDIEDASVTLLAGAGDNGGDGLFAAAALADEGATVTAVATGRSLHDAGFAAFVHAGGKVLVLDPAAEIPGCASGFTPGEAGERLETAVRLARRSHLVIDAMTGIGLAGDLRGVPAALAASLGMPAAGPDRGDVSPLPDRPALPDRASDDADLPLVLAVDTPSGVGVDDGALTGAYIPADETVMFGAMKPCAVLPPATFACGRITLVDFGFDLDGVEPAAEAMSHDLAAAAVRLPRVMDAKYSRGVVGLATGSARYPGAAVLTARAAARTNAGMVRYLGPERAQDMVLAALPEAVIGKGHVQSWAVGSGVPDNDGDPELKDIQRQTIAALLAHYSTDEDGSRVMPPIVVDAGALDLMPDHVPPQVVITPHAGELARLLGVSRTQVETEPFRYATEAHERTGATVLLKGAATIVVGDGEHPMVSGAAPAWLATAGAGDVLAGIAGALLAQMDDDLDGVSAGPDASDAGVGEGAADGDALAYDAALVADTAAAAAYLHGVAAGIASESGQCGWQPPELFGMTSRPSRFDALGRPIVASDVIAAIPDAIADLIG
ncbi:bifunctional ADP-dependent NAD(P)H-hydrate dehydratase/NAD(P)H-hydrate epimerase [Bifidobacterium sp. CP2]|uniref:bifunctional ADP-dependent NAD(P)H-hydrate dehydratase/NAD(P)H-hydrate epimerase n=1 Tax=Bifidobacterium sp. CP2 TaxID=2809025 RepID=UPI001BDCC952|nr:bifunctional ADP-dependent NAD(P)H-hydrate dehydratase/NAD(P)H-hydrate epimerase [Bifidobacterium sp. CP2]MBT1180957.1 bifunctional ADP-dependent NAD(P)H-hydrate dehydratase/NAD(P)H-hydrate epimerase [Bifidobacterium sp. CP2]